jgi:hypothetical protein
MAAAPPFSVKLWIYPGANPASVPSSWGIPQDVSAYIRHPGNDGGQVITYTAGRQDEASQVDAGTLSLTLDNRAGQFSSHNALGQWAGLLDTNTPYQFGTVSGSDTFTRTVASGLGTSDSGQTWGASSAWSTDGAKAVAGFPAANTISLAPMNNSKSADYDVSFTIIPSVVSTGAAMAGGALQRVDNSNYIMFRIDFYLLGVISARIHRIGGSGDSVLVTTDPVAYTYSAGQRFRMRCQRDGYELRMKFWPEASAEPLAWTCIAQEDSIPPSDLGVFGWRLAGNSNAGTVTVGFDDIEISAIEQAGTVVQWPVRWNKTGANCWAPIQGAGILRRLQQGKGPRKSPLTRQLGAYSPTGFWPIEDQAGATSVAATVTGTQPGVFNGVTLAADSTLPGTSVAAVFNVDTGFIKVNSKNNHSSDGFSAMFFTKMAAIPSAKTAFCTLATTGLATTWVMSIDATSTYVDAYDSDGTLLSSAVNLFSPQIPTDWIAWQLETAISGANTAWSFIGHQIGETTYYAQTGSHASTVVSQVRTMKIGSNTLNGMAVADLWLGPNSLPFVTDSFSLVSDGYRGELASDRIARICLEEGIPVIIEAGDSDPCGPQQEAGALEAIRAAELADMGILYERGTGLGYRPRTVRYLQDVLLALSVAAAEIDDPPEPILDDQRRANSVLVSRVGGSSATVTDGASLAKIGYYPGPTVNLNVDSDDVLPFHAGWRVYLGSRKDLRWPGMSLNFARNPGLLPTWRTRGYGPRMTVVTGRPQVQGSDPDVIIEGYSCTLWPAGWKANLACSSAQGWDVYTLGDDLERIDADNSELDADVTTTVATTIQVDNNGDAGNTWVPTSLLPAEVPFYIKVGEEIMQVASVGDIFSTTKQILTVVRGVNGGAALHSAGISVRLAYPMILAL